MSSNHGSCNVNDIPKPQNRLSQSQSPYLLQHATNPVNWYEWSDEAFEKARKENKPIFLSIGYSTCHWCHVMAHESFEDEQVAEVLNRVFVCIKVDREERPDIDNVYMQVCQMLTGSGGWPLTILMTPDKKPFFAGTYFPKNTVNGRIGVIDLANEVEKVWTDKHDQILLSAQEITEALKKSNTNSDGPALNIATIDNAYKSLSQSYDSKHGGFSNAPKFPTPHNLTFILRQWHNNNDKQALAMVENTLQQMRKGGIYDHIGFGFHRYSTDRTWLVPHFEKMLYDQASLAIANLDAYQAAGKKQYAQTAREIFTYVLRDMTDDLGGFYSAEDADSEGVEGKFYVWSETEIKKVLDKDAADLIIKVFGVSKRGNFHDEASGQLTGANILHLTQPLEQWARQLKKPESELSTQLESARQKLFNSRENRIHPYKDNKVLTDWNGLMIAALARGSQILDAPQYYQAGKKSMDFILSTMLTDKGRLLHRWRNGQTGIEANLDDYAFLVWALLELYQVDFEVKYLEHAIRLNDIMLEDFWDDDMGGFFFTADHGEKLLIRQKDIYDGAIPSGNSIAMLNLLKLSRITNNTRWADKAEQVGKAFAKQVNANPSAYTQLMQAVDFANRSGFEIIIVGSRGSVDVKTIQREINSYYLPNKIVIFRPTGTDAKEIIRISPYLADYKTIDDKATVYICQNYACMEPVTEIADIKKILAKPKQND
ncbi:MAG: thioredoxin domain-containing protein [Phycisphaerae bacterium]|nr:thioredoxin domain-containing protein [Phycisphaerae bacterium]